MKRVILATVMLAILITVSGIAYSVSVSSQLTSRLDNLTLQQEEIRSQLSSLKEANNDKILPIFDVVKDSLNRTIILIPSNVEPPKSLPEYVVVIKTPAERIVSLAPSITGTLFKIGLGERIVALTKYDDWPQQAVDKKSKGDVAVLENMVNPEVERVAGEQPDLVIATKATTLKSITKLEQIGIPVVVVDYGTSVEDILHAIILTGKVSGAEESAKLLANQIQLNISLVARNASSVAVKPKVFWFVWQQPLTTAGGSSFINALIEEAGGNNTFEDVKSAWPVISPEEVLARNPDVIIISKGHPGISQTGDLLALFPAWKDLKAVKEGRVFFVPTFYIQPGPRTGLAVEELAKIFTQSSSPKNYHTYSSCNA